MDSGNRIEPSDLEYGEFTSPEIYIVVNRDTISLGRVVMAIGRAPHNWCYVVPDTCILLSVQYQCCMLYTTV